MASEGSVIKQLDNGETTHPDDNVLFPLKLGNVFVASDHLGAVQGPEAAHHFDGALRRVGHLPPRLTNGNSPMKLKCILDASGAAVGRGRGAEKGGRAPLSRI